MTPSRTAWDAALDIIGGLRKAGHVALLAGGCVRDRLLGQMPQDYDVATDAAPDGVKELFPKARRVGAKFGVMLVRRFGHDVEVATFRSDVSYSDGRHPDAVTFGTERDDALRRDFTINGLFFDPLEERVIDYVNGLADLAARVIRTIGDPERRFDEDHLRMLRAVRFAARLDFTLDPVTREAIVRNADKLESISAERIWQELEAILVHASRATGWRLLIETGLRTHLAAGWASSPEEDRRSESRLRALAREAIDGSLALACALCERTPQEAVQVGRTLKLSSRMIDNVEWLVLVLPLCRRPSELELADLKQLMAHSEWSNLLELLRVERIAAGCDLTAYEELRRRAAGIAPEAVAPAPLITGDDLLAVGVPAGPGMGSVLKNIYRQQLNEQVATKEQAMAAARRLLGDAKSFPEE